MSVAFIIKTEPQARLRKTLEKDGKEKKGVCGKKNSSGLEYIHI